MRKGTERIPSYRTGPQPGGAGVPGTTGLCLYRGTCGISQRRSPGPIAALRSGLGIGVYSSQLARRHALARLLPEQVDFSVDVWIAMQYEAELFKIFHASFGPVTVIGIDGLLVILQAPRTIAVAL